MTFVVVAFSLTLPAGYGCGGDGDNVVITANESTTDSLSSCSGAECEVPKPDLVVSRAGVNAQGFLEVSIRNVGFVEMKPGIGAFDIFVDGRFAGRFALDSTPHHGDYHPARTGVAVFTTSVRMTGENRRVSIHVDPDDEISEENEYLNTYSRLMHAPDIAAPNFQISRLYEESRQLVLEIINAGNQSSAKVGVHFDLTVGAVDHSFAATLPPLTSGATVQILPPSPIHLGETERVSAHLTVSDVNVESDNTDNAHIAYLPGPADISRSLQLLEDPVINADIIWEDGHGARAYAAWKEAERQDLYRAIRALMIGENPSVPEPPLSPWPDYTFERHYAWRIYIAAVAQSIWVEASKGVRWQLRSMSSSERRMLLDARELFSFVPASGRYRVSVMGANPVEYYEFLQNFGLVRSTPLETVYALTDWMRSHLRHSGTSDPSPLERHGYPLQLVERMLWPPPSYHHIAGGCGSVTRAFQSILRAVNIPVVFALTNFGGASHASPDFLTIQQRMPHADDVFGQLGRPSGPLAPPASALFYDPVQFKSLFISPASDCNEAHCNNTGTQILYNYIHMQRKRAFVAHSDRLFNLGYRRYERERLEAELAQDSHGTLSFAFPLFSFDERQMMLDEMEAYAREVLGNGSLEDGLERSYRRYQAAQAYAHPAGD